MAEILKLKALVSKLQARAAKALGDNGSVIVGFTQNYAIYVHENLEAHHPRGQAKFLEQPARTLAKDLGLLVLQAMRAGKTMVQGLLIAGLRLQREAQLLCPIDTGALRNSAFTRIEGKQ